MERFIKGDIIVVPFPFSNLKGAKKRPAFVLADLPGDDIILCQITSQYIKDNFAVPINNSDFSMGSLPTNSIIRTNRIFTADKNIIIRKAGRVKSSIVEDVVKRLIDLISN